MVEYAAGTADKASNSIVGHRHFPAVAALWFAALLGLGSLAIRPALIESAFAEAVIPDLVELRDAFERAKPLVRELARKAEPIR